MGTVTQEALLVLNEMLEIQYPLERVNVQVAHTDEWTIKESMQTLREYEQVAETNEEALHRHLHELNISIGNGMKIVREEDNSPIEQAIYIRRIAKQMEIYSNLYGVLIEEL
ncbi:MAG: hypothetical protein LBM95_02275 [Lactobacillales bacterium]|jgi:hypothetical protein|nr:hypothetical protein [Lactobacillales bacterium]